MGLSTFPAPSLNTFSFRNQIRNGDFGVWQRGIGPFQPAVDTFTRTADGWHMAQNSTGNPSFSRAQVLPGQGQGRYAGIAVVDGQTAASSYYKLGHRIEGVHTLQGKRATIQFRARVNSGTAKIGILVRQDFGTGGTPSSPVTLAFGSVDVDDTDKVKSLSFNIPSIFNKTRGTNNDDFLEIELWLSAGANNAAGASNIGLQNNTFTIGRVQLEEGPVATPFEELPQALQLQWCQRYFRRYGHTANGAYSLPTGIYNAPTTFWIILPLNMRSIPTIASHGAFAVDGSSGSFVVNTWTLESAHSTPELVALKGTASAATATTGGGAIVRTNGADQFLLLTAEL